MFDGLIKYKGPGIAWSPGVSATTRESSRAVERVEDGRKTAVRKKIEGKCETWPGQPGRSDPNAKWIPALPVKKRANSRNQQIIGATPEVIEEPIEGVLAAGMD